MWGQFKCKTGQNCWNEYHHLSCFCIFLKRIFWCNKIACSPLHNSNSCHWLIWFSPLICLFSPYSAMHFCRKGYLFHILNYPPARSSHLLPTATHLQHSAVYRDNHTLQMLRKLCPLSHCVSWKYNLSPPPKFPAEPLNSNNHARNIEMQPAIFQCWLSNSHLLECLHYWER